MFRQWSVVSGLYYNIMLHRDLTRAVSLYGTLGQRPSQLGDRQRCGRAPIRHSSLPYKPENRASTQKAQQGDDNNTSVYFNIKKHK